jgi:hypothetical protein
MRKLPVIAMVVASVAGSTNAAPRHWYTDKKWWIGESVNLLATGLDANSTCCALSRGSTEGNIILGPHPSCRNVAGMQMGAAFYWTFFHVLDWHFWNNPEAPVPNRALRIIGYTAIPVAAAAIHGSAAIHNYRV